MIAYISLKSAYRFIILNGVLLTWKAILRAISKLGNHYAWGSSFEIPVPSDKGKI